MPSAHTARCRRPLSRFCTMEAELAEAQPIIEARIQAYVQGARPGRLTRPCAASTTVRGRDRRLPRPQRRGQDDDVKMLCTLLEPMTGRRPVGVTSPRRGGVRRRIGYVSQAARPPARRRRGDVANAQLTDRATAKRRGEERRRADPAVTAPRLAGRAGSGGGSTSSRASSTSRACAPDEPTGLDPQSRANL